MFRRVARYCREHAWEVPANVFEVIALVLVVFVQDVAFRESIVICAALLIASLGLHGVAYRRQQCQVWPKVIELAAPLPFLGMLVPAYLATVPTQRAMFIILNFYFVVVEAAFLLVGRNFMEEYYNDWSHKQLWGTPLLRRCSRAAAATWITCQAVMGLAQVCVVVLDLSLESNAAGAVLLCYVMQLLPLVFAVVWTFAFPAWLRRRWGYTPGVLATAYPPHARATLALLHHHHHHHHISVAAADGSAGSQQKSGAGGRGSKGGQPRLSSSRSSGSSNSSSGGGGGVDGGGCACSSLPSDASSAADACIRVLSSSSELEAEAGAKKQGSSGGGHGQE